MHSPFLDPLGAMLDVSLPLTLEERGEWGDPRSDAAAREAIAEYAPYDNLPYCYSQGGGAIASAASTTGATSPLPPLLICAARNDPRVPCTQALRYVNRARHRSTPPGVGADAAAGPLLLHVQSAAGHHGDGGRFRRLEGFAMEWAFIMYALQGEDTFPNTL
jgi:oligopeptidase B